METNNSKTDWKALIGFGALVISCLVFLFGNGILKQSPNSSSNILEKDSQTTSAEKYLPTVTEISLAAQGIPSQVIKIERQSVISDSVLTIKSIEYGNRQLTIWLEIDNTKSTEILSACPSIRINKRGYNDIFFLVESAGLYDKNPCLFSRTPIQVPAGQSRTGWITYQVSSKFDLKGYYELGDIWMFPVVVFEAK